MVSDKLRLYDCIYLRLSLCYSVCSQFLIFIIVLYVAETQIMLLSLLATFCMVLYPLGTFKQDYMLQYIVRIIIPLYAVILSG